MESMKRIGYDISEGRIQYIIAYHQLILLALALIGARFSPFVKNQGGEKNANLQYLRNMTLYFDEMLTISRQMILAYNTLKPFGLPHRVIS